MNTLLRLLPLALLACDGRGKDATPETPEDTGVPALSTSPRLYRLTHVQWEMSARELLQLAGPTGLSETFLGDTLSEGFDNDGEALRVDPTLFQDYQRAAEALAEALVQDPDRYNAVVPQDARSGGSATEFSEHIEAEDNTRAEYDNGAAYSSLYLLWSNGELRTWVDVPYNGRYRYTARLYGSGCPDGTMASGGLRVDGVDVLTFTTTEDYGEYAVELELGAGEVELAVFFENDSLCDGQGDRNFYIDWLALDGVTWLGESTAGEAEARAWIAELGARAHRRPLSEAQVDAYHALFLQGPDLVGSGDDFADGVRLVLTALLQSPWFLYRTELGTEVDASGGIPLDDYELAAKLSFALWNAPPDDTLWAAAEAGALSDPEVLKEQARRLLADPKAEAVLDDFHGQLYHLDATGDLVREDFPDWQEGMGADLREETERFLKTLILQEQGGVRELYSADWSVLNPALAALYGVSGPAEGWAQVELPPSERAGLLTQASFLAPRADSHDPSPIQRGVFINRTVLCVNLPDPPDDASGLPPLEEGSTNRERVEAHTGEGTCGGSCHSYMINPPGFAFENYDAVGAWRDSDNGQPVDASGEYYFTDGPLSWVDGPGLAALIAGHPDAHSCYAWRWLSWTHARPPTEADKARIAPLVQASVEGLPITELLVELVAAESFRTRSAEEAD